MTTIPLILVNVSQERDVVLARQRARQVAALLGFDHQDQVRIATAVSELARNAFVYAGAGRVIIELSHRTECDVLNIKVTDQGRGIANLEEVLSGQYRSPTGMGAGLTGSRRLMDEFEIQTSTKGTTVRVAKFLERRAWDRLSINGGADRVAASLAATRPHGDLDKELHFQNRELLMALDELRKVHEAQAHLNRELDDTNRGVVALYAELEDRAAQLRKADELKNWFLSSMSHEFRTPLNSILAISQLLVDRVDGPLSSEQGRQASLIHSAASQLLDLVNDLLDMAKVKAGRISIHTASFHVDGLFGSLRALLRPLLTNPRVSLIFNDVSALPEVISDEHRIAQVLRNFISNALKFTDHGSVIVDAQLASHNGVDQIVFSVADTGIGISPGDLPLIFQEFTQVDSPMQRRSRGTGLGLPLAAKFAQILGGEVLVRSTLGKGSVFSLRVPLVYSSSEGLSQPPETPDLGIAASITSWNETSRRPAPEMNS